MAKRANQNRGLFLPGRLPDLETDSWDAACDTTASAPLTDSYRRRENRILTESEQNRKPGKRILIAGWYARNGTHTPNHAAFTLRPNGIASGHALPTEHHPHERVEMCRSGRFGAWGVFVAARNGRAPDDVKQGRCARWKRPA